MTAPAAFVLGVDLDGVCADYTAAFAAIVAAERGCAVGDLPAERGWDFDEWRLEEAGGFDRLHRFAVLDQRMFRTMPAIDGCAEALWRLSDAGVWIRIVTHRLVVNWGHQIAVADTVAWLDEHNVPYRDLCFLGTKPQVEAHCYVEDAPHNVVALRDAGNHVIVFEQPYNAGLPGPRARTWDEVEEAVLGRMSSAGFPVQVPLPGVSHDPERLRRRVTG
ncbi:MAG: 5' nucleotidase, NT5C type [Acidimicrobiales bacterium]